MEKYIREIYSLGTISAMGFFNLDRNNLTRYICLSTELELHIYARESLHHRQKQLHQVLMSIYTIRPILLGNLFTKDRNNFTRYIYTIDPYLPGNLFTIDRNNFTRYICISTPLNLFC